MTGVQTCALPIFFLGYLKDEMATAGAWAGDWFHTGDVVRKSAEGDFHFVDRRKNVIRRSGENISAVEVESVLNQHPAVKTSAVAATPDAVRGDEVLACIVLREEMSKYNETLASVRTRQREPRVRPGHGATSGPGSCVRRCGATTRTSAWTWIGSDGCT